MRELFAGLTSGTSGDGVIDAVLVDFSGTTPCLIAQLHHPYSAAERAAILALAEPGADEIDRLGRLDVALGKSFAQSIHHLLATAGVSARHVRAIGSHGQTVRHRPGGAHPFTLQIADPNTIAELTGITTVTDFRRRDMAAGGQGAPLAPAFHAAAFRNCAAQRVVANLGGMTNISILPAEGSEAATGFDTGPGNTLMDAWIAQHRGERLDRDGAWAREGIILGPLLARMLEEPFFRMAPPKSAGRELFNLAWLEAKLVGDERPQDVQSTLCELTAVSLAGAVRTHAPDAREVVLCGGGAYNGYLRGRIAAHLTGIAVNTTARFGIAPEWVEAVAFAWLARQTLNSAPGNLPEVTSARHPVILGGIYPA